MTADQQLIEKMFYETFLEGDKEKDPVAVLGEAYFEEQKKEVADLSAIRFAQGEVYFHYKDFETAVFKWESIRNALEPWARKNIGDAYFELGWLPTAEDVYKSIHTDNLTLTTEVSLQLFSLYLEQEKTDLASQVIKETVMLNPDYPNVTALARAFFEEQQDGLSMVELAMNEAIRLESVEWFDCLHQYIKDGYTKDMDPAYFDYALLLLFRLDRERFEDTTADLWNIYKSGESHTAWIMVINRVLNEPEPDKIRSLSKLTRLYKESYLSFINGSYLIKDISALIPNILTKWLRVSDTAGTLTSAAAVVSWNEMFPGTLETTVIHDAETILLELENRKDGWEDAVELSNEVLNWAKEKGLQTSKPLAWLMQDLKNKKDCYRLIVVGTFESGKEAVINSIAGAAILSEETTTPVIIEHAEEEEIYEISETDIQEVERMEEIPSYRRKRLFYVKMRSEFLRRQRLTLINTPNLNGGNELVPYLHAADGILFVLNAHSPFTVKEQEHLQRLKREMPGVPIHFLVNKMDSVYDEREMAQFVDVPLERIKHFEPNADVFAFSPHYSSFDQLNDLRQFFEANYSNKKIQSEQTAKLLYFVREMISYLFMQRAEKEKEMIDSIKWNEEMLSKLNGAINQMDDISVQKARTLTRSYQDIKEEIRSELAAKIPQILRECSEIIKEESHFGKIHVELNKEMNKRVEAYLQTTMMPHFFHMIQNWIENCAEELNAEQLSLNEMGESFNALYDEEKIKLQCDFQVLEYWQRDAERITSGINWEYITIIPRFNPAQLILKSAGKLLGVVQQKNAMLYNKYKDFVETYDYKEAVQMIISSFLKEFELFERNLNRDMKFFFKNPLSLLHETVEESLSGIEYSKAELEKMRENPEWYQDPLTLFELKLRQYEWLNQSQRRVLV
ncbi:dynamin family protein [Bacillus benzoevorans]|uniref:Tetratricopeptide (TPR) repeat protein n=1 Tax=Bacillus benzoevorans TaxID=1456 RepID=A0A7X0HVR5_9BACI|nr:dynamin family protein [Bacillus benzoevorans]MBB6447708.1 tetratricopeptide (TPR) repeat protein [Bacillus benzoevorans]